MHVPCFAVLMCVDRCCRAKVDGTAKLMSDTPEPVTNIDLQHALERVKSYRDESVGEAKTLLNNLGLVVKNETEGLGAQVTPSPTCLTSVET